MVIQLLIRTEKYMVCSFDQFFLKFHMSVTIVSWNLMIEWEHTCEDTEPRRQGMCGIVVYTWKISPAAE